MVDDRGLYFRSDPQAHRVAGHAQRRLHGAELVGRLIRKAEAEGYERISAWVADDIPANDFWNAMGFRLHGQRAGGSKRGRMHNAWVYWCAAPRQLVLLGPNAI
jgi:L-amino acid N-acyltransferase YncA